MTDAFVENALRQADELAEGLRQEGNAAAARAHMYRESVRRYDGVRAARLRRQWAAYYRMQVRVAEATRERALSRLRAIEAED